MKIICVTNQKGGTGKSSTAAALAQAAANSGKKVLAVDMDPQANLSFMLGAVPGQGTFAAIMKPAYTAKYIQSGPFCDVLAADQGLDTANTVLHGDKRVHGLSAALQDLKYDLVIIDTPPSLDLLQLSAVTASDLILIPCNTNIYNIQGLQRLYEIVKFVSQDGKDRRSSIVFTRYNDRANVYKDMAESIEETCKSCGFNVCKTRIREGVAIQEAQTLQKDLFKYAPKSKPAADYMALVKELKI